MMIDADVDVTARRWGLPPQAIQAMLEAEGNKQGKDPNAILRAVRSSLPKTVTRQEAIEVACRSFTHALSDFIVQHQFGPTFVSFLANRWAPVGAANDPHNQNKYWPQNVTRLWLGVQD